jgi:hypothetical protein
MVFSTAIKKLLLLVVEILLLKKRYIFPVFAQRFILFIVEMNLELKKFFKIELPKQKVRGKLRCIGTLN